LLLHQLEQYFLVFMLPRSHSKQHFIANDSQRKYVSLMRIESTLQTLRSHICWCTYIDITCKNFLAYQRKSEIAYFPGVSSSQNIWRFKVSMQHFFLDQVFISRKYLLHHANGCTLCQTIVFFDKGL